MFENYMKIENNIVSVLCVKVMLFVAMMFQYY